jgi:hypothetical protein
MTVPHNLLLEFTRKARAAIRARRRFPPPEIPVCGPVVVRIRCHDSSRVQRRSAPPHP